MTHPEAMGVDPKNLGKTEHEMLCEQRAMDQWRASLKRPDLTEEDRVRGAVQAYQRQAFVLSAAPAVDGLEVVERLRAAYDKVAEWPENRMRVGAVEELGPGFSDLLALRNLAPDAAAIIQRLTEENEALRKERDQATTYLHGLLTSFVREHFPENKGWQAFPDLIGMLTQIDNASTIASEYQARIKALEEALLPLLNAAQGLSHGSDWNKGAHAIRHGYRQRLIDAIPAAARALSSTESQSK